MSAVLYSKCICDWLSVKKVDSHFSKHLLRTYDESGLCKDLGLYMLSSALGQVWWAEGTDVSSVLRGKRKASRKHKEQNMGPLGWIRVQGGLSTMLTLYIEHVI